AVEEAGAPVDADHRSAVGLEVQVAAVGLDHGLEVLPERRLLDLDVNLLLRRVVVDGRSVFLEVFDAGGSGHDVDSGKWARNRIPSRVARIYGQPGRAPLLLNAAAAMSILPLIRRRALTRRVRRRCRRQGRHSGSPHARWR